MSWQCLNPQLLHVGWDVAEAIAAVLLEAWRVAPVATAGVAAQLVLALQAVGPRCQGVTSGYVCAIVLFTSVAHHPCT